MTDYVSNFWELSLRLYAQPQIAHVCLHLQDAYGVNVNFLLWCYWLEQQKILLTPERLQQAHLQVDNWEQDYVLPLRGLRRKLKLQFGTENIALETLRQDIKQAELLAEKQMQKWLELLANQWPSENDFSTGKNKNLLIYLTPFNLPEKIMDMTLNVFNNNQQ